MTELARQYASCFEIYRFTSNGFPQVFVFPTAYSRRDVRPATSLTDVLFKTVKNINKNKHCGPYRWERFGKLQTDDRKDFEKCIKNFSYVTRQYVRVTLVPVNGSRLRVPREFVFLFHRIRFVCKCTFLRPRFDTYEFAFWSSRRPNGVYYTRPRYPGFSVVAEYYKKDLENVHIPLTPCLQEPTGVCSEETIVFFFLSYLQLNLPRRSNDRIGIPRAQKLIWFMCSTTIRINANVTSANPVPDKSLPGIAFDTDEQKYRTYAVSAGFDGSVRTR